MIIQIFAIHDNKAKSYLQPFFMHNKDMATRSFSNAVNDEQSQFNKHPLDYTLFHLGQYDDELGLLTSQIPPDMITNAITIKQFTTPKLETIDESLDKLELHPTPIHKEPNHEI